MLLNVWQSERDARGRRSAAVRAAEDDEGRSLVEALHTVGFSGYANCIGARSILGLAAEEFPTDALWMDRCAQLDALASALQVCACSSRVDTGGRDIVLEPCQRRNAHTV